MSERERKKNTLPVFRSICFFVSMYFYFSFLSFSMNENVYYIYTHIEYICVFYMRCIITQKKKKKRKHKRDEYRRRILNIIVGARNSNSVHFEVFARLGDTQLNRPRLFYFIYIIFLMLWNQN